MDLIVFLLDSLITPEARPSFYALLLTIAGVLMIVGMKAASLSLIGITILTMFMGSPVVEGAINAFLDQLPAWIFWPLMAAMAYGLVAWVMIRLVGKDEWEKMLKAFLSWLTKGMIFAPFRLIWFLLTVGPIGRWALLISVAVGMWYLIKVWPPSLVMPLASEGISTRTQLTDIEPFLDFPLTCWSTEQGECATGQYLNGAYTVASPDAAYPGILNSVLDHNIEKVYAEDGVILAFTGEQRTRGLTESMGSYPDDSLAPVSVRDLYRGDSSSSYRSGLNYDGHPGYDYYAEYGVPVFAAAEGVIVSHNGQRCIPKGLKAGCDAWGFMGIDHGNGYITQYGHLSEVMKVAGEQVQRGELIGRVGHTGPLHMGDHLHFEVLKSGSCSMGYCVVDPYGWEGMPDGDPLEHVTGVKNIRLWKHTSPSGGGGL